jgi:hypothetical protein
MPPNSVVRTENPIESTPGAIGEALRRLGPSNVP